MENPRDGYSFEPSTKSTEQEKNIIEQIMDGDNVEEIFQRRERITRSPSKSTGDLIDLSESPTGDGKGELRGPRNQMVKTAKIVETIGAEIETNLERRRTGSLPEQVLRKRWNLKKRERESDEMDVANMFETLTSNIKAALDLVNEHSNTKKEIKRAIRNLNIQIEEINRIRASQAKHDSPSRDEKDAKRPRDERTVHRIPIAPMKDKMGMQQRSCGTQTENNNSNTDNISALESVLHGQIEFDHIKNILNKELPAELYKVTEVKMEKVINTPLNGNVILYVHPTKDAKSRLLNKMTKNITGAADSCANMEVNVPVYIKHRSTTWLKGEQYETNCSLCVVPVDDECERDIFEVTKVVKQNFPKSTEKNEIRVLASEYLCTTGKIDRVYIRNVLEAIYHKDDIKIIMAEPPGKLFQKDKANSAETSKIIIKGDKSYAEKVKHMKEKVTPEQLGIRVTNIKKTARGDLMMIVRGRGAEINDLTHQLGKEIGSTNIVPIGRGAIIRLSDVEITAKTEDILEALKLNTMNPEIITIRDDGRGGQTVLVRVNKEDAAKLVHIGKIRIGWGVAKVRLKVDPKRCMKCLAFGHTAKECTGQDRKGNCFKCGEKAHKAVDCVAEEYCMSCNKRGHRADRAKCPIYREQLKLEEVRAKEALINAQKRNKRLQSMVNGQQLTGAGQANGTSQIQGVAN